MSLEIEFEPIGLRTQIEPGTSLLDAAQQLSIQISAVCGGNGTCGACKVQTISGNYSALTVTEKDTFSDHELQDGFRLACQAIPLSDCKITIPSDSISTAQKLQLEGADMPFIAEDSVYQSYTLHLSPPTICDLRSDQQRLMDAMESAGIENPDIPYIALQDLSDKLRALNWHVQIIVRKNTLVNILHPDQKLFGVAFDIGTTKIAAFLINLCDGKTSSKIGEMNPQISYGEDVVSRIAYTEKHSDGRILLQRKLIETINKMTFDLCAEVKIFSEQICSSVFVCNTAIHHLFCNLPVRQLGLFPFIPAETSALALCAADLGLNLTPSADVYLPPNIAGYVGADHVAMMIGSKSHKTKNTRIAIDIGTNTELSLIHKGEIFCCSCASGPAFEGAHIQHGMRAASGAIEKIKIINQKPTFKTIDDIAPIGICGSGILDGVAELRRSEIINHRGQFDPQKPNVQKCEKNYEYILADESISASKSAITITRGDINEIVLAKSAIRTGISLLLEAAGIQETDVEEFTVAGAFGTYLDIRSAITIGMFPALPLGRFTQIGNAAGTGARLMLLSLSARNEAETLAQRMNYVELTTRSSFHETLIESMQL